MRLTQAAAEANRRYLRERRANDPARILAYRLRERLRVSGLATSGENLALLTRHQHSPSRFKTPLSAKIYLPAPGSIALALLGGRV